MRDGCDGKGTGRNHFLHSVDCRDLGCEHACVADSLHQDWMDLLEPGEKEALVGPGPGDNHAHHKDGRCLPDWNHSPEESKLDQLRDSGTIKDDDAEDRDGAIADSSVDLITFPSLESFFGQCTGIIYYKLSYKITYCPFIGK